MLNKCVSTAIAVLCVSLLVQYCSAEEGQTEHKRLKPHHPKHDVKAYGDHPEPVYSPPSSTQPTKKDEAKKVETNKEVVDKKNIDAEYEAKLAEYKADPYHYYDHDYLKNYHPKDWVKVSDYKVPSVKHPMTKVEEETLKDFMKDRVKTLLKLKHMTPLFKDWKEQEDFEVGAFIDKLAMATVPTMFAAAVGTILPLWGFTVPQPATAGRKFGGSRWYMMWEHARQSLPIPTEGVDKLARTVTEAVVSHEECGQRLVCEAGRMVDALPRPISRMARVIARVARTMRPEQADLLAAFEETSCETFKCGGLPLQAPPSSIDGEDVEAENP